MLTQENEYYIRLILLLLRGGTLVLKQTFMKKLADQGSQLNGFLQVNKETIRNLKEGKVLTLKQYNILFPKNGNKTKICELDISLLSCLLLNLFAQSLQKTEEKAIENIRTFRNDYAAHHPDGCIDARTFFRKWNQLSTLIINLGNGLSSSERSDLVELIKCVGEDPIDIKHAIEHIKDATGTTDQFMEHVTQLLEHLSVTVQQLSRRQDEISNVLQDTHTDIKELKSNNCNISTVIVGEVTVSSKNPEAVISAAKLLIENTKKSQGLVRRLSTVIDGGGRGVANTVYSFFARVKGYFWGPEVSAISEAAKEQSPTQRSVTALVQDIHNAGGEVIDVTEGSMLLHIQCHSVHVVLDVLKYFQSSDLEQRLNDIAECLTEELGCRINLSACIQVQSLLETFRLIEEQNTIFTKRVRFSIKCQTAEGVLNVFNLFEDGNMTNKLSTISEDFSNELGTPVKLRASIDTTTLQEYVSEAGGNKLEQDETEQVSRLESFEEKEAGGALSKVSIEDVWCNEITESRIKCVSAIPTGTFFDEKEKSVSSSLARKRGQSSYKDVIELLRKGEKQYEFVAFLLYSDSDEKWIESVFIDELNKTLQRMTGTDRELVCTERNFREGHCIFDEYMYLQYLEKSAVVIATVSNQMDDTLFSLLNDADGFGKKIVPLIYDDDFQESVLKGFTNLSKVRLVLKKENGKYTLPTTLEKFCRSIIMLIAMNRLESLTEKETGGAMSKVSLEETGTFFDKKKKSVLSTLARKFTNIFSRGQSYQDAIELLRKGENQYKFVAFLLYSDGDEGLIESFVLGELNSTLQSMTGVDRELLCTERKFRVGHYIFDEYVHYLERSALVIATVSKQMDDMHFSMLKDADAFGKKIVPLVLEGEDFQESVLKGFTNLSKVRLVLKMENGKYILPTKLKEFCRSIITLIASPGERVMSYDRRYRIMSGASAVDRYDSMQTRSFFSNVRKTFTRKLSRNQSYEMYISHLKNKEYGHGFVAFLDFHDKDTGFVRGFVIDELNATLQSLTGVNRGLICTKDNISETQTEINVTAVYEKYLKKSSVLIVYVTENISGIHMYCLRIAHDLGMDIIPMIMEDDEDEVMPLLKGLRNVSKVRIIWKFENGQFILKTPWKKVCRDILELAASSKHAHSLLESYETI